MAGNKKSSEPKANNTAENKKLRKISSEIKATKRLENSVFGRARKKHPELSTKTAFRRMVKVIRSSRDTNMSLRESLQVAGFPI